MLDGNAGEIPKYNKVKPLTTMHPSVGTSLGTDRKNQAYIPEDWGMGEGLVKSSSPDHSLTGDLRREII